MLAVLDQGPTAEMKLLLQFQRTFGKKKYASGTG